MNRKLKRAFDALNEQGIIARADFACCATCGYDEITDEINEARDNGLKVKGFCFYHRQDADNLLRKGGCCLAFGSVKEKLTSKSIGRTIVTTLKSFGIKTEWNGDEGTRIFVTP